MSKPALLNRKYYKTKDNAIVERTPTGAGNGQRHVKKGRNVNADLGRRVAIEGTSVAVCKDLGIPPEWAELCEDSFHVRHNNQRDDLAAWLDLLISAGKFPKFEDKIRLLGLRVRLDSFTHRKRNGVNKRRGRPCDRPRGLGNRNRYWLDSIAPWS